MVRRPLVTQILMFLLRVLMVVLLELLQQRIELLHTHVMHWLVLVMETFVFMVAPLKRLQVVIYPLLYALRSLVHPLLRVVNETLVMIGVPVLAIAVRNAIIPPLLMAADLLMAPMRLFIIPISLAFGHVLGAFYANFISPVWSVLVSCFHAINLSWLWSTLRLDRLKTFATELLRPLSERLSLIGYRLLTAAYNSFYNLLRPGQLAVNILSVFFSSLRALLRFLPTPLINLLYRIAFRVYGRRYFVTDDQITVVLISLLIVGFYVAILVCGYTVRLLLVVLCRFDFDIGPWQHEREVFRAMVWFPDSVLHEVGLITAATLLGCMVLANILHQLGWAVIARIDPIADRPQITAASWLRRMEAEEAAAADEYHSQQQQQQQQQQLLQQQEEDHHQYENDTQCDILGGDDFEHYSDAAAAADGDNDDSDITSSSCSSSSSCSAPTLTATPDEVTPAITSSD